MSEKRRDNRGRILQQGESQRSDGRYCYQYTDSCGKRKSVYSWRLDKNDRTPPGIKREISLREKKRQIQADLFNQIVPEGAHLKVVELVEKYVSLKTGVSHSTQAGYKTVINMLENDVFGLRRIDKIKLSDAKKWLADMQKDGKGYSTIRTIRGIMRLAFQMAVDDDLIRKNPFSFELISVIYNDSITREALTHEQERKFLAFVKEDKHFSRYYDGIYILFNTGLRISEFTGLTKRDIDFKNMKITVNHQLQRYPHIGYQIVPPKTKSGDREIPMTREVAGCFRRIIKARKKPKTEPVIDGYSGFLFLDKNDMPMVAMHWEKYFQHVCGKYNKIYKVQMPKVTPHVCRHTFCSRMAAARMNPKTLQYIMGHSDISVTLGTYTHTDFEDVSRELIRVSSKH